MEHTDTNHTDIVARRMATILSGASRESLMGTDLQSLKLSQRAINANVFPNITVVPIPDDYIHYNRELPTLSVRNVRGFKHFQIISGFWAEEPPELSGEKSTSLNTPRLEMRYLQN